MRRRSGRLHLNAEINVVSLIDVMMLLLVIFMITAPLMQGGVDVKLPQADTRALDDKSSMVITVDASGAIFVGRDRMTYGEFASSFKALVSAQKASAGVTLRGDRGANWENMARVLAVIRSSGVEKIGIATEPEPPR